MFPMFPMFLCGYATTKDVGNLSHTYLV